jgi:tRNA pseudouridine55 synthase
MSSYPETILSRLQRSEHIHFLEGCLILVDKPLGWTSFDVVNKIRFALKYALNVKKIKVGHAGTLDPLATGLLLVCTGRYTKMINQLQGMPKAYTGTIRLGATTPTYDAESEPDHQFETGHITEHLLLKSMNALTGWIDQVPPIYSAIKIKGQAAYSLARRGKDVKLKPRRIYIDEFKLLERKGNDIDFYVSCSKGTYIRSLAHDLGYLLNSGAYLNSLRRVSIGDYHVNDALHIEDITGIIDMLAAGNKEG